MEHVFAPWWNLGSSYQILFFDQELTDRLFFFFPSGFTSYLLWRWIRLKGSNLKKKQLKEDVFWERASVPDSQETGRAAEDDAPRRTGVWVCSTKLLQGQDPPGCMPGYQAMPAVWTIRMPALVPCTQPDWQEENSSKLARCPRLLATATPELIPQGFAWYTNFCILYPRRPEIFIFFLISM